MPQPSSQEALTRLLAVQYRSLAMYLHDASPWTHSGDERAVQALKHIVADQKALCTRIADFMIDRFGRIETGEFPLEFTGLNDCGLDYLVFELIASEKQIIAVIQRCIRVLTHDRAALALAEESLGLARGHLESLEESLPQPAKPPVA
jgi:hypothetical protein